MHLRGIRVCRDGETCCAERGARVFEEAAGLHSSKLTAISPTVLLCRADECWALGMDAPGIAEEGSGDRGGPLCWSIAQRVVWSHGY